MIEAWVDLRRHLKLHWETCIALCDAGLSHLNLTSSSKMFCGLGFRVKGSGLRCRISGFASRSYECVVAIRSQSCLAGFIPAMWWNRIVAVLDVKVWTGLRGAFRHLS